METIGCSMLDVGCWMFNGSAAPDSPPADRVASHLPKAQPLSPNASKAKEKARSMGSFNPR